MKPLYAVFALAATNVAVAQDCSDGRYTNYELFPTVTTTSAVAFGANLSLGGSPQTLYMDVYEPTGDTMSSRPVVIVAFGGSFISGSRADVADFCTIMAKLGYVVIAPDYRVGFFIPNENSTTKAVMRCAHDLRGCIRYLRKSVAELGNPYRIDTDRIIIGGVSAGAIGALHLAYLNESSEMPPTLYPDSTGLGGLEGNSGNAGYSSSVMAAYSFSGCIGDTSWIVPNDLPLVSVHEVNDGVVPYNTQEVEVIGIATGLYASGSSDIHKRMQHLGIANCFLSYPGSDHVGYLAYDPITSVDFVVQFCAGLVCGPVLDCGTLFASVEEPVVAPPILLYPDPASDHVSFAVEERCTVEWIDLSGVVVLKAQFVPGLATVDISGLAAGYYTVRAMGATVRTGSFLKVGR